MTPLEQDIRRTIAIDGPIPVARYMALCLGHPVHGYYMTRDPFGARGDFVTAPEVSQMFGELIGLWAVAVWQLMGAPARFNLVELGPGRGTLMADALRASRIVPGFRAACAVHLVETSPALRRHQQAALTQSGAAIAWHAQFVQVPDGPLIVIANEFFDALPVHHAVRAQDGWHERMIGIGADDRFVFALAPDAMPNFDATLPVAVRHAPQGALFEWRDDAAVDALARSIARFGGAALIIDYGHATSAVGETLQAVRGHSFVDVLESPGEADLTAHVDFAALARAGEHCGVRAHGPVTQGDFLRRLGVEARAAALKSKATPAQATAIDTALLRLTGTGKETMGELFKALALAHSSLDRIPGFER